MKATDLIRGQHEVVRDLFEQVRQAPAELQGELRRELAANLRAHLQMEQELLYPKLQEKPGFEAIIDQSVDEHSAALLTLSEFERTQPGERAFQDGCRQLQLLTLEHMGREERELLPKLDAAWTNDTLDRLGLALQRRHALLVDEALLGAPEELGI